MLPVADDYNALVDQTLDVSALQGLLGNDDGASPSASVVDQPRFGTLDLDADGSFSYVPEEGFIGTDDFTYSLGGTETALVTIDVHPSLEWAYQDSYFLPHDGLSAGNVRDNDADVSWRDLSAALVTGPTNGTLTFNSDGTFDYSPNAGFVGTDSFDYHLTDGVLETPDATVTLTVTNSTPVAGARYLLCLAWDELVRRWNWSIGQRPGCGRGSAHRHAVDDYRQRGA